MSQLSMQKIVENQRLFIVTVLGFSSGLPLTLTSSTLQAWFTEAGIGVVTIGALSLVGIPYVWKFLWSPLMDWMVPPLLGRRRGWILIMQIGLCITLFWLAHLHPQVQPAMMGLLALGIAFLSASQDIAIDAYRTDVLLPEERGLGAAAYIFAYRMAMLVAGGLALIFADHFGWRLTYEWMAILLACSILATWKGPEPARSPTPKSFMAAVIEPFADLSKRRAILVILLFIIFYKLGDALALSLMSNFLLHGIGFSLTEVGLTYKTTGLIGTIAGAFLGGSLLIRLGLYRALLYFGLAQAFSNIMFMFLALAGKNYFLMFSSILIESFCSGMSTAAFVAFIMTLCHQRYTATQFACLSALAAVGRVFLGPVAGVMVEHLGWVRFYGWSFIMSFPGIFLLLLLRQRVIFNVELETAK